MIAPLRNPTYMQRLIIPAHFFSTDEEKIKLNWFLFEYALECEAFISRDKNLCSQLSRKKVDNRDIAFFCIHHAKQMKNQILDRVSGNIAIVRMSYEGIESYFPQIGDELVDRLLTKIAEAWDSQTGACVECPTRCISEKDKRASMFDDQSYWE